MQIDLFDYLSTDIKEIYEKSYGRYNLLVLDATLDIVENRSVCLRSDGKLILEFGLEGNHREYSNGIIDKYTMGTSIFCNSSDILHGIGFVDIAWMGINLGKFDDNMKIFIFTLYKIQLM